MLSAKASCLEIHAFLCLNVTRCILFDGENEQQEEGCKRGQEDQWAKFTEIVWKTFTCTWVHDTPLSEKQIESVTLEIN